MKTFEPHRDWQSDEFKVSLLPGGRLSLQRGYVLRFYREGFELAFGIPSGGPYAALASGLDRLFGTRWALRYADVERAALLERNRVIVEIRTDILVQRFVILSKRADKIAQAFRSNGVTVS